MSVTKWRRIANHVPSNILLQYVLLVRVEMFYNFELISHIVHVFGHNMLNKPIAYYRLDYEVF